MESWKDLGKGVGSPSLPKGLGLLGRVLVSSWDAHIIPYLLAFKCSISKEPSWLIIFPTYEEQSDELEYSGRDGGQRFRSFLSHVLPFMQHITLQVNLR